MPIDKRHRTSCCHRHTNCWGEGNLGPEALESVQFLIKKGGGGGATLPHGVQQLDKASVLGLLQTSHHTALHHRHKLLVAQLSIIWNRRTIGLGCFKENKNVNMFCIIYKQSWVYLGWRLCTLYLLTCHVSYHRWFRSLLCSCDSFWVLNNCFCWFPAKVPVKSTMTTVALFGL